MSLGLQYISLLAMYIKLKFYLFAFLLSYFV